MHHENTCGSITLTCSECHLTYPRRDAPSHTESKCTREQLRQLRQEFATQKTQQDPAMTQLNKKVDGLGREYAAFKQQYAQDIAQLNGNIEKLRNEFATHKQQQGGAMTKLAGQLTNIETKLDGLRREFATDQQRQDQVITELPDRLTQIETKMASLNPQVERLERGNIQSYLLAVSLQHVVLPTRHPQYIFYKDLTSHLSISY